MAKRIITSPELAKPIGYSHGIVVGNMVYLGGQTGLDRDGRIVPGGIVEQFERALRNVLITLEAAGGKPSDLVDITIYLTDVDDYQRHSREIGRRWRALVGSEYPAMAGIGVDRLWQANAMIEIKGVAILDR